MGWLYAKRSLRRGAGLRQSRAPRAHKRLHKSAVAVGVAVIRGGQAMMRLVRRASLLVAFVVLISAATAYAECAWVLWSYDTVASEEIYALDSAHPSLQDCEAGLKDFAAVLKNDGYTV